MTAWNNVFTWCLTIMRIGWDKQYKAQTLQTKSPTNQKHKTSHQTYVKHTREQTRNTLNDMKHMRYGLILMKRPIICGRRLSMPEACWECHSMHNTFHAHFVRPRCIIIVAVHWVLLRVCLERMGESSIPCFAPQNIHYVLVWFLIDAWLDSNAFEEWFLIIADQLMAPFCVFGLCKNCWLCIECCSGEPNLKMLTFRQVYR